MGGSIEIQPKRCFCEERPYATSVMIAARGLSDKKDPHAFDTSSAVFMVFIVVVGAIVIFVVILVVLQCRQQRKWALSFYVRFRILF